MVPSPLVVQLTVDVCRPNTQNTKCSTLYSRAKYQEGEERNQSICQITGDDLSQLITNNHEVNFDSGRTVAGTPHPPGPAPPLPPEAPGFDSTSSLNSRLNHFTWSLVWVDVPFGLWGDEP